MSTNLQIISVITILHHKGKFLLVKRSANDDIFPNKWQNLGGKVELGETIEQAINREVKEEIGWMLSINEKPVFVQSYSWKKDEASPVRLGVIFLLNLPTLLTNITLDKELSDYGWYTLKEAETLDTIGKISPTGTLSQIRLASSMI